MYVALKNQFGRTRQVKVGIAWTPLFFGGLPFFFRGMPWHGVPWTLLFWILVVPAIYLVLAMNQMTAEHWLKHGYEPIGEGWETARAAWSRSAFPKAAGATAIALVVLVALGGLLNDGGAPTEVAGPKGTVGDIAYAIDGLGTRELVGGRILGQVASEGAEYVVVAWHFTNVSDRPIGAFSQPRITLADPKGVAYSPDIGASAAYATETTLTDKVLSDVNPGVTIRTADVSEVRKGAFNKDWSIVLDAGRKVRIKMNGGEE